MVFYDLVWCRAPVWLATTNRHQHFGQWRSIQILFPCEFDVFELRARVGGMSIRRHMSKCDNRILTAIARGTSKINCRRVRVRCVFGCRMFCDCCENTPTQTGIHISVLELVKNAANDTQSWKWYSGKCHSQFIRQHRLCFFVVVVVGFHFFLHRIVSSRSSRFFLFVFDRIEFIETVMIMVWGIYRLGNTNRVQVKIKSQSIWTKVKWLSEADLQTLKIKFENNNHFFFSETKSRWAFHIAGTSIVQTPHQHHADKYIWNFNILSSYSHFHKI